MKFWNINVDSERFCLYIKSYFFSKRRLKKLFFWKPKNPSKKKTSANFRINEVNCGKIQDQFDSSVLKTGITNWSQIWCLCLTILELLKTQHCALLQCRAIGNGGKWEKERNPHLKFHFISSKYFLSWTLHEPVSPWAVSFLNNLGIKTKPLVL